MEAGRERSMAVFRPAASRAAYLSAVAEAPDADVGQVPVLIDGRHELEQSVALANALYGAVAQPAKADLGVQVGADISVEDNWVVRGLATRWAPVDDLATLLDGIVEGSVTRGLIVGVYARLTSDRLLGLLQAAGRRPDATIGIVSGRDAVSVAWMAAKQWAQPGADVTDCGLISGVTALDEAPGISVWGPAELRSRDVKRRLLSTRWRSIMFYGHARDDHIVLGKYTVCGRNDSVPSATGTFRPQCGYGLGCFNPEAGLIDLRRVAAVEIVLNGCLTGPLSDLALYDHKYLLLLNALDGVAQRVSCAMSAHHAGYPDNAAWADEIRSWAFAVESASAPRGSALTFDTTLASHLPFPAFWHFGVPARPLTARPVPEPASDVLTVGRRVHAFLATPLLSSQHPVRPPLAELNDRLSLYLDRDRLSRDARRGGELAGQIRSMVASVDALMAECIRANPEDDLMSFGTYLFHRGVLQPATTREDTCCSCGRGATRFTIRPHLPALLPVTYVMCPRCGDVEVSMADTPRLTLDTPRQIAAGESAGIAVTVTAPHTGDVWAGAFVAVYGRADMQVEPTLERRRVTAGGAVDIAGTLRTSAETVPQVYYIRAFAVSNLGLSTARRRFRVYPRRQQDVVMAG